MGWFSRKAAAPTKAAVEVEWKSAADFLAVILLRQLFDNGDRPLVTDKELARLKPTVRADLQGFIEPWTTVYVAWLFRLFVRVAYGKEFADAMMADVSARFDAARDHTPSGMTDEVIGWFQQLDHAGEVAATSEGKINGHELPLQYFMAVRFLSLQGPFAESERPNFADTDIQVATALIKAHDIAKPNIDFWIEKSKLLPR